MISRPSDHVLIVDDDFDIRHLLSNYLIRNGMRATAVANGRQMRAALHDSGPFDLLILDLTLQGEDGIVLCRELRTGEHRELPILMLTARGDEADRILGMEMGADDYLVKPFASREVLARIRAILRRARMLPPNMRAPEPSPRLLFGEWQLDTHARHLLDPNGEMVTLSGAEYRLLHVFLQHPRRVLTRDQLLSMTQGREADIFDRSIDVLVSRLRLRLREDVRDPRFIKTMRNAGYVFSASVEARG